jgi:formylglycine-generating enzyme required for sulfatase activity
VVNVSWGGAAAYTQFYGKRLPTEAEWEKAARGGLVGKRFPWGDSDPDGTQSNFADKSVDDGYRYTAPVGSFTPNGYGLYDMAGNVGEWCSDWYGGKYYSSSPSHSPTGPSSGTRRVVRGGSWNDIPLFVRVASRMMGPPTFTNYTTGFRCASQD